MAVMASAVMAVAKMLLVVMVMAAAMNKHQREAEGRCRKRNAHGHLLVMQGGKEHRLLHGPERRMCSNLQCAGAAVHTSIIKVGDGK